MNIVFSIFTLSPLHSISCFHLLNLFITCLTFDALDHLHVVVQLVLSSCQFGGFIHCRDKKQRTRSKSIVHFYHYVEGLGSDDSPFLSIQGISHNLEPWGHSLSNFFISTAILGFWSKAFKINFLFFSLNLPCILLMKKNIAFTIYIPALKPNCHPSIFNKFFKLFSRILLFLYSSGISLSSIIFLYVLVTSVVVSTPFIIAFFSPVQLGFFLFQISFKTLNFFRDLLSLLSSLHLRDRKYFIYLSSISSFLNFKISSLTYFAPLIYILPIISHLPCHFKHLYFPLYYSALPSVFSWL